MREATPRRVLVAGMGNLLHGDDGFGIEVVRRLHERADLPPGVRVIDVGIGGIPLVQELLDGYELLIIVDAVRRGKPPGTVVTLRPELPETRDLPAEEIGAMVGDPHTTTPSRVLLLARALGALPGEIVIVGCEPLKYEEMSLTLSAPVAAAVDEAANRVSTLVRTWLATGTLSLREKQPSPVVDLP
ncbi:MAG: hydrogenase maturation protease [Armatimonadota bacterium]